MSDHNKTLIQLEQLHRPGMYLGRQLEHDPLSRNFAISHTASIQSVAWKRNVPIYWQGKLGSCTGDAMAGCLSTKSWTHKFHEATAVRLYELATQLDGFPGTYPPDDTGSSGLGVAKAAQSKGYITTYEHAFSFDEMLVAMQRGPGIVGTNWYNSMFQPDADGFVTVDPRSGIAGGHEYECVGVDTDNSLLTFANSWGSSWGFRGYFFVSFDDFSKLLADNGDFTQPVPVGA